MEKNGKKTKKRPGLTYFTIYEKTPWLNHRMKNGKEQKEAGFDLFYNLRKDTMAEQLKEKWKRTKINKKEAGVGIK